MPITYSALIEKLAELNKGKTDLADYALQDFWDGANMDIVAVQLDHENKRIILVVEE